jgi:T5SS/PEP-CTERM-associated repeat protein
MSQRGWWDGAFWWNWGTNPNGANATSFTPQFKLAEDVLAEHYGGVTPALPVTAWNSNINGNWTGGGGGGVWTNGSPSNNFVAVFDRGAAVSYVISLTANRTVDQIRIGSNTVTFQSSTATDRVLTADNMHTDEARRAIIIGVKNGDVAVVNTTSTLGSLNGAAATIGDAAGASGTVNLDGNVLINLTGSDPDNAELIIGRAGYGTLNLLSASDVRALGANNTGNAILGQETGSVGVVNVTNIGSAFAVSGTIQVGLAGQGLLTVTEGIVSANEVVVGPMGELRGNGLVIGDLLNSGLISPDAPGSLRVSGDFAQDLVGHLSIDLGSTVDLQYDRLEVTGSITLAGTLIVELISDFMPQAGDTFNILDWGTSFINDGFALTLPMLDNGLIWDTSQLDVTGVLSVVESMALSGDYNGNGVVDAADYTVWRDTLGQMGDNQAADGDASGTIDVGDYDVWKLHFGQIAGSGSGSRVPLAAASAPAVPEPATILHFFSYILAAALLGPRHR